MDNTKNIRKILFFAIAGTALVFFAAGFYYAKKNPNYLNSSPISLESQAKFRACLNNPNVGQTVTDQTKIDPTKYFRGEIIAVKDGAVTIKNPVPASADGKKSPEETIFIDADTKIVKLAQNEEYQNQLKLFVNKEIKEMPREIKEVEQSASDVVVGTYISGKTKLSDGQK